MNIVDQKIEHLHYLYKKRVNHTLEIKTAILNMQHQVNEKKHKFQQETKPLWEKTNSIKISFILIGVLLGTMSSTLVYYWCNKLVDFMELVSLARFSASLVVTTIFAVAFFVPCLISFRLVKKNKEYLNLNQKIKENVESYSIDSEEKILEKLEKYLYKSIQEEERIHTLIQEFERERERLKEEVFNKTLEQMKDAIWQKYAPSVDTVALLNQLQQNSKKGMQKTYYQETQKTNT